MGQANMSAPMAPTLSEVFPETATDAAAIGYLLARLPQGDAPVLCRALGAVIGEVWGDPAVLDFTATKRLAMRSEAASVPCWLVRRAAAENLSAARDRWRIGSRPSATNPHDRQSSGLPRWSLDLFRSRRLKPGAWVAEYDRTSDRLYRAPPSGDGTLAAGDGASRDAATG